MRTPFPLAIVMLFVLHRQAAVQEAGERVRLTLVSGRVSSQVVGTLARQDQDSLWVRVPGHMGSVAVARGTMRLETSRGWDRATVRGAGIGAGLGAITGFVWGGVAASESRSCGTPDLFEVCYVEWYGKAFRGGLIGAAVGGALGAALGYTVKTERWGLSVAPRGHGLQLSLAF